MACKQHERNTPSWCSRIDEHVLEHQWGKTMTRMTSCLTSIHSFSSGGLYLAFVMKKRKHWVVCLSERYLDGGVKRRSILLFEAGSDVQHVHLAPRHHYSHQGVVISSSTLNMEVNQRLGLTIYEITFSHSFIVHKSVKHLPFHFSQVLQLLLSLRPVDITSDIFHTALL